jgi:flagellar basal-body rod modification protein FlgD
MASNIDRTTSATSMALEQNGVTNNSAKDLQNKFLKLLTTQMRHQDPLNPLSNAELTSQLAQISTLESLENMRSTLLAITGQIDVSKSLNAVSLLDKGVLVPGNKILLGTSPTDPHARAATPAGVELRADAAKVEVKILDAAGNLVCKLDLGMQKAGVLSIAWDGKNDAGMAVSDGAYNMTVTASDAEGKAISAEALTFGKVQSLAYAGPELKLDLGLAGQTGLSNIRKVLGS